MKCSKRSFAVVCALFAVLVSLSTETLNARDADLASHTFAAASFLFLAVDELTLSNRHEADADIPKPA